MNFELKTRNCVSKTRKFALQKMYFAGVCVGKVDPCPPCFAHRDL